MEFEGGSLCLCENWAVWCLLEGWHKMEACFCSWDSGNLSVSSVGHELPSTPPDPAHINTETLLTSEGRRVGPHSKLLKTYSNIFFTLICIKVACKKHWVDQKAWESLPSETTQLNCLSNSSSAAEAWGACLLGPDSPFMGAAEGLTGTREFLLILGKENKRPY